ncbi:hypothetical protein EYF80_008677 [Liparis tanakae]|uniref:Uncharacterized protein n=1 Tax=Liparis tanakae TaxID=230148 RepID=A0A4Z2IT69_9TELE|nr:hypothetical protein EYF80_008677 [Liparis tanakae]
MEMGGLLDRLMKSLLRTTLLKGAFERRARNLYNCKNQAGGLEIPFQPAAGQRSPQCSQEDETETQPRRGISHATLMFCDT